jgi:hypothetical protein
MRYKARLIVRREKIPMFKWVIASLIPCNFALLIQCAAFADHESCLASGLPKVQL